MEIYNLLILWGPSLLTAVFGFIIAFFNWQTAIIQKKTLKLQEENKKIHEENKKTLTDLKNSTVLSALIVDGTAINSVKNSEAIASVSDQVTEIQKGVDKLTNTVASTVTEIRPSSKENTK